MPMPHPKESNAAAAAARGARAAPDADGAGVAAPARPGAKHEPTARPSAAAVCRRHADGPAARLRALAAADHHGAAARCRRASGLHLKNAP